MSKEKRELKKAEITEGKSLERVILYASAMAMSSFILDLLSYLFGKWDGREHEIFNFRVKKILAESVMNMSYSTLENPEMQNYVWLAEYNRFDNVIQLTTAVVGSTLTVFGISAVVFTLNPLILMVIVISSAIKYFIDRHQKMLPHQYNDDRAAVSRENEYYSSLMGDIKMGKEIRANNLENWVYAKTETSWQNDLYPREKKFTQTYLGLTSLNGIISMVQDILIYLILALEVIYSTMTVGDFSMYLTAAGTFSSCVMGISGNYSYLLLQTSWYLRNFRRCLGIAEKIKEDGGHTHIDIPQNVEIEFRNNTFMILMPRH